MNETVDTTLSREGWDKYKKSVEDIHELAEHHARHYKGFEVLSGEVEILDNGYALSLVIRVDTKNICFTVHAKTPEGTLVEMATFIDTWMPGRASQVYGEWTDIFGIDNGIIQ